MILNSGKTSPKLENVSAYLSTNSDIAEPDYDFKINSYTAIADDDNENQKYKTYTLVKKDSSSNEIIETIIKSDNISTKSNSPPYSITYDIVFSGFKENTYYGKPGQYCSLIIVNDTKAFAKLTFAPVIKTDSNTLTFTYTFYY